MEVHEEVGFWRSGIEAVEQTLKQVVLVAVQVVLGEEESFYEKIIADYEFREQLPLRQQFLQLLVALGHKKQLHGKGIAFRVFIKIREEGVVGELFENEAAAEILFHHLAEGSFSGAYISFDGDKIMGKRLHAYSLTFGHQTRCSGEVKILGVPVLSLPLLIHPATSNTALQYFFEKQDAALVVLFPASESARNYGDGAADGEFSNR